VSLLQNIIYMYRKSVLWCDVVILMVVVM